MTFCRRLVVEYHFRGFRTWLAYHCLKEWKHWWCYFKLCVNFFHRRRRLMVVCDDAIKRFTFKFCLFVFQWIVFLYVVVWPRYCLNHWFSLHWTRAKVIRWNEEKNTQKDTHKFHWHWKLFYRWPPEPSSIFIAFARFVGRLCISFFSSALGSSLWMCACVCDCFVIFSDYETKGQSSTRMPLILLWLVID